MFRRRGGGTRTHNIRFWRPALCQLELHPSGPAWARWGVYGPLMGSVNLATSRRCRRKMADETHRRRDPLRSGPRMSGRSGTAESEDDHGACCGGSHCRGRDSGGDRNDSGMAGVKIRNGDRSERIHHRFGEFTGCPELASWEHPQTRRQRLGQLHVGCTRGTRFDMGAERAGDRRGTHGVKGDTNG